MCETSVIRIVVIKRADAGFVFFFGQLFIEEAILLLPESCTAKAIGAPAAIEEEGTVPALLTELAEIEEEAVFAIRTFVASLGSPYFEAIDAVLVKEHPIAVERVLVVVCFNRKVTVLGPSGLVHVFAVLKIYDDVPKEWNGMEELIHLFEERTGEVEITAVVECIPIAAIPVLMVVGLVGRIGRED